MRSAVSKLREIAGDGDPPASAIARRLAERALAVAYGKLYLRACDGVGARVRCSGPVRIENQGSITLGDDVVLGADRGSVRLSSARGGSLRIGARVTIEHGSWLSAAREVHVGSDVAIGPCCVIADADADTLGSREDATPIHIGDGVRLAARVIVRPGARIGEGAIIGAGSVVEGAIPPRALASGIPARVVRVLDATSSVDEPPTSGVDDPAPEDADDAPASERRPKPTTQEVDRCV